MERINKGTARKLFNEHKEFWITAVNMQPYAGLLVGGSFKYDEWDSFDKLVNAFEYYNCNNECGRYAAFYVED